jgi:hypothetical protein
LEADEESEAVAKAEAEADAEIQARYAMYKEQRAEERRGGVELSLIEYAGCLRAIGRDTPEERYQSEKERWYFHECSSYDGVSGGCKGFGCTSWQCIPECRYYADKGRIEDQEVIAEWERWKEKHPQDFSEYFGVR